ncbi:MAG: hypothetical protein JSS63_05755 [Bacteroidetes bacterium]|nr:hypothetical protein [Bacteroidota bacterium]MBX7045183.1 hypothetical protein [Ignavibacteria bacterium]
METPIFSSQPIDVVFLVFSLFFPRISIIGFFFFDSLPATTLNNLLSVLLTVFFPRILVIIMIAQHMGTQNPWFWIHIVVALLVYLSGSKWSKRRFGKGRKD